MLGAVVVRSRRLTNTCSLNPCDTITCSSCTPSLRYASMLLGRSTTDEQQSSCIFPCLWLKHCCLEEIVRNTLGCQLQDSKNRLHGSSPTFSGIWGQCLGDSSQDTHQQTRQSSEHRLEDKPWCHENHSHSWNGEDRWRWTTWGQEMGQTSHPCRKDEEDARPPPAPKAQRPHKKQIEQEKSQPPSKRTCRHPHNWCTPVWKTTQTAGHQKPYMLRSGQPFLASLQMKTRVKQFWGLWLWTRLTSTIQQHPGHTSMQMAQLKTSQETEDMVLTSSAQANHYLCQHLVGFCPQTTELKS